MYLFLWLNQSRTCRTCRDFGKLRILWKWRTRREFRDYRALRALAIRAGRDFRDFGALGTLWAKSSARFQNFCHRRLDNSPKAMIGIISITALALNWSSRLILAFLSVAC